MKKINNLSTLILISILVLINTSCGKEENPYDMNLLFINEDDLIITNQASNITTTSATISVNFEFFTQEIIDHGLVWDTNSTPTINDSSVNIGVGNDNFEYTLYNLKPETEYFVRAYANTEKGITYGNEIHFTTTGVIPIDYKQYTAISEVNREVYYLCNFNEPSIIWPTYNSDPNWFYAKYTNHGYEIRSFYSSSRLISGEIEDISQNDFEIEYVFERVDINRDNSVSFIWGLDNNEPMKFYYIKLHSNSGPEINIGSYENELNEWVQTNSDDIHFNNYNNNKYTIRRIENKYYFFINEVFIFEHDFEKFFGNKIGIVTGGGGSEAIFKTMKIDYLVNLE